MSRVRCVQSFLIYMSIRVAWMRRVQDGELFQLSPLVGDRSARTVLLTRELDELLSREMEEGEGAKRRNRLLETLQNIVAGRHLVVCMQPFEADRKAVIGRLAPLPEHAFPVWDIRCLVSPALRVFCLFVEKDVLLAVTCRPRSVEVGWLRWSPLGDWNSKRWRRGIEATHSAWTALFPAESPVTGDDLRAYLSNASLQRAVGRT